MKKIILTITGISFVIVVAILFGLAGNKEIFDTGVNIIQTKERDKAKQKYTHWYKDSKIEYEVLTESLKNVERESGKKLDDLSSFDRNTFLVDKRLEDKRIAKEKMDFAKKQLLKLGVNIDNL